MLNIAWQHSCLTGKLVFFLIWSYSYMYPCVNAYVCWSIELILYVRYSRILTLMTTKRCSLISKSSSSKLVKFWPVNHYEGSEYLLKEKEQELMETLELQSKWYEMLKKTGMKEPFFEQKPRADFCEVRIGNLSWYNIWRE